MKIENATKKRQKYLNKQEKEAGGRGNYLNTVDLINVQIWLMTHIKQTTETIKIKGLIMFLVNNDKIC